MSHVHQFEVKIQLKNGLTTTTAIYAETDYKARQLVKMQFGDEMVSIHYLRKVS
jgi:hypothetical protein